MSAAQYEEGLITAARARAAEDAEKARIASDEAQAKAVGQREQKAKDYYSQASGIIGQRKNLSGMLSDITKNTTQQTINDINQNFGQSRGRLLDEQASMGGIRQPNSRYAMGQAESMNSKNISDAIAKIQANQMAQQYATENQSISDLLNAQGNAENIGAGYQTNAMGEFQNLRGINQADKQQTIEQALAPYIGRMQAEAKKPGTLDYINTAISGLSLIPQGIAAAKK